MKKAALYMTMAFLSLIFVPTQMKADTETISAGSSTSKSAEAAHANTLLSRLFEIKKLNKLELNSSEKKQLRDEVSGIKGELKELGGGVYLSVGAIIVIILLLILLL